MNEIDLLSPGPLHITDTLRVSTRDATVKCPACDEAMNKIQDPGRPGLPFGLAYCQNGASDAHPSEVTAFWMYGELFCS